MSGMYDTEEKIGDYCSKQKKECPNQIYELVLHIIETYFYAQDVKYLKEYIDDMDLRSL